MQYDPAAAVRLLCCEHDVLGVAEFVPHGERHPRLNVDVDARVKFAKQPHKSWNDFSCVILRHAEPDVAGDLDVLEALPYFSLQFQNSAGKRKQRGSRRLMLRRPLPRTNRGVSSRSSRRRIYVC